MSPLTPDERAEAAKLLRAYKGESDDYDTVIAAGALADKLEAEPDLMGALADSLKIKSHPYVVQEREKARTERDEAREALRDLIALIESEQRTSLLRPALIEMAVRGRAVLEGVERTHRLVPDTVCAVTAEGLTTLADAGERFGVSAPDIRSLAAAFEMAARGERVEWPA